MPIIMQEGSSQHRMFQLVKAAIAVVVLIALPFILAEFQVGRLNRAMAIAVAVLGLNLVVGFSGLLALCQSAFMAVGAFVTASLIMDHGWGYFQTLPAAMLGAFVVGVLIGVPALRITGLYLAMTTVAFAAAFPGLAKLEVFGIAERTGGANGREITTKVLPPEWLQGPFKVEEPSRYQYFCLLLIAVVIFWAVSNLLKSRTGRAIVAIRDNQIGAAVSGVNLTPTKVLTFALSAAIGGAAGTMQAMNTSFVAEQDYLFPLMVDMLVALVVGGVATVYGSIIGALVVVFLRWFAQTYVDIPLSWVLFALALAFAASFVAKGLKSTSQKFGAVVGVGVVGSIVGWLFFSNVDFPELYRLDGNGPLSQAIFGLMLIVMVFFAPQGVVGFWRQIRNKFLWRVVPQAPALPEGLASISPSIDLTEAQDDLQAAT